VQRARQALGEAGGATGACDYETYCLCTDINLFQAQLPGWDLTRSTSLTYRLVASSEHPIYTIYSAGCVMMGLSFFYLPDPLPPLFVPCYSKGTPYHHLLFYKEHNANSHKRKHTEETTVTCVECLPSFPIPCVNLHYLFIRVSNSNMSDEANADH
jgi:hypothetical protein